MAVCPCGDVFGEPVAVGLVVAGHPGDGDVGGWGEVELVVGGGDFHDDVGFCFKGQGFDDRCDGGNCGFVSGEEESACSAGAPVQSGAPVGGTVVWADEDEGSPGRAVNAQALPGPVAPWVTKSMSTVFAAWLTRRMV